MTTAKKFTLLSLLVICSLIVFGCSKDDEVADPPPTTGNPTIEVDPAVAKMDIEQLRTAALKCKAEVEAKMAAVDAKSKEVIKSLTSDDASLKDKLNAEMAAMTKEADALANQFGTYVAQIKAKGGDLTGLETAK